MFCLDNIMDLQDLHALCQRRKRHGERSGHTIGDVWRISDHASETFAGNVGQDWAAEAENGAEIAQEDQGVLKRLAEADTGGR